MATPEEIIRRILQVIGWSVFWILGIGLILVIGERLIRPKTPVTELPPVTAAWLTDVLEHTAPVVQNAFTVYHHDNLLLYTGYTDTACHADALARPFFVHVVPVSIYDMPVENWNSEFQYLDFDFRGRQLPLDIYFEDQPPPGQVQCAALLELPEYPIARIRTGQYVPGEEQLWAATIRFDIDAAWLTDVLENTVPVVQDAFTVYHHDNQLLYTGTACQADALGPLFFVHIIPVNAADLPAAHRQHGMDFLGFRFQARQLPLDLYFGDQPPPDQIECAALIELPEYPIARIKLGQYIPNGPQLWGATIWFDIDAAWLTDVLENTVPVVQDAFTVYHHDNQLLYTGTACQADVLDPPFFVHVIPVNAADMPRADRQRGFAHRDFHFQARQLPLDLYFGDQPPPDQIECAALIELPEYPIARIRTGQYVPNGPQLWGGTIWFDTDAAWLTDVLENTVPVVQDAFTVYHHDNQLLYTGTACQADVLDPPFFVHVIPVNAADMPRADRQRGFAYRDFHFQARQLPLDLYFGDQPPPDQIECAALIELPEYPIARIKLGQYVPAGDQLWATTIWFDIDAAWLTDVLENTVPVVQDAFTVYHHDNQLLYTGTACQADVLDPPFFVHVIPVDAADVPAVHRQYGMDIRDFRFQARQLPLDLYFGDQPPPDQIECAALIELPEYPIARIRTGQYVPGGDERWAHEFEISEATP